ncbi:unnamed protein product [Kuraishia capsulata CBS 1993]|uniref:BHLH domain-containing protein n=1 Tax=Kuraishia capsulata CBS 1993 TaxID=1382522 RepID=W6MHR8_9ASCO|nr:uncharacterized protein KUCA_T00001297001 [Kuraishia capsulata CBS 1993]CDK25328.1 unnamed protein product [Kuraishia capsulata CBS 1993]
MNHDLEPASSKFKMETSTDRQIHHSQVLGTDHALSLTPQQLDDLASWADYTNFNEGDLHFEDQLGFNVQHQQHQSDDQPAHQGPQGENQSPFDPEHLESLDFYNFQNGQKQPSGSHSGQNHNPSFHRGSISNADSNSGVTEFLNDSHLQFQSPFVDMPYDSSSVFQSSKGDRLPQSYKPEVIFTPLISPAVTPLDSNRNKSLSAQGNGNFSPLTSPALEFQHPRSPVMRTKRSPNSMGSSSVSPPIPSHDEASLKTKKPKTPASTPLVGPSLSGRMAKQSPVIKARRGGYTPSLKRQSSSSFHGSSRSSSVISMMTPSSVSTQDTEVALPDAELMLPPPVPRKERQTTSPEEDERISSTSSETMRPATPAMLMSFTMQKLQQNQNSERNLQQTSQSQSPLKSHPHSNSHDNLNDPAYNGNVVFANPRRHSSTQSSPVILPSSSSMTTLTNVKSSTSVDDHPIEHTRSDSVHSNSGSRSYVEEKMPDKKVNHKLAEQGRRNRMNVAIQELEQLIPEPLRKTVVVPSKATTVELASRYIAHLQEQIRQMRGLENNDPSCLSSNSSISPLDYAENK